MGRTPAAVLALFCAQLVFALSIVPPWQNPDEPQHLMTVRLILRHGADFVLESDRDAESERAIVASMARYWWWQHYGEVTPNPLPSTFADGPARIVKAYFGPPGGGSRLYYRSVAALVRGFGITDLLPQLYTMRGLSALAGLLTLVCVWAGTRLLLDAHSALVVTSVMALHPQFVLVSTTASPDQFVNLAGAAVWWQAAVLLTSPTRALNAALLLSAAVLALLIRRMGATLIVIALGVLVASVSRAATARERRRRIGWALTAAAVVLALARTTWTAAPADLSRAIGWIRFDPLQSASTVIANIDGLPRFLRALFNTFWLAAGWLRYSGPGWWGDVSLAVSVLVGVGGFVSFARIPSIRPAAWLAGAMVMLQVAVVVAYYFGVLLSSPQGRYLFPVLPAIFCLVWLGWRGIFAALERQPLAAISLIALMAFLNLTAWTLVILPAFA